MSYPSGPHNYYPAQQPGGFDAYTQQFGRSGAEALERLQYLRIAVAVLGVASYAFSYGLVLAGGGHAVWTVRFALFAGLLAAFGLAHEQTRKVVATLAVVGFADALSVLINTSSQPGWALWVILVVNGLQALAAIGAVVSQPGAAAAERAAASAYQAYAGYYAQASQYYDQYGQQPEPEAVRRSATAHATGHASQPAVPRQARRPTASAYGSYAEYAGDYGTDRSAPPAPPPQAAAPAPQAGLPSFGHASGAAAPQYAETDQAPRPTAGQ